VVAGFAASTVLSAIAVPVSLICSGVVSNAPLGLWSIMAFALPIACLAWITAAVRVQKRQMSKGVFALLVTAFLAICAYMCLALAIPSLRDENARVIFTCTRQLRLILGQRD
jgi:hypothetical protein